MAGFLWWFSGKESAYQYRELRLNPRSRKSLNAAMEQLSPVPWLLSPQHPGARAPQQEKPPQWEAQTPQLESRPHSPQLEKAHTQQRRPGAAKNINKHLALFFF